VARGRVTVDGHSNSPWCPPTTASKVPPRGYTSVTLRLPSKYDGLVDGGPLTRVLVLGPMQVVVGGVHRDLGATTRSAVLARLVIARGRSVMVEQLAEDVWPSNAEDAGGSVRVAVNRLRDVMGKRAIVRRNGGYALDLDLVGLDLVHFERLAAACIGGAGRRLDALNEALALWSGRPFAGLDQYPFVGAEIERLDMLHDHLVDERFGLLLDNGAGAELIGELELALHDRPLNEYRCAALMTALYRAGRQVDALAVLRRTVDRLRDEYGLSPGPQLREIERQVLQQDPILLGQTSTASAGSHATGDAEAMLSSATALGRVGAWEPALRFARQALVEAQRLGEPALICHSLLTVAQVGFMSGEDDTEADPAAWWAALREASTIARRQRDGALLTRAAITRFQCGIAPADDRQLVGLTEPLDYLPRRASERVDLLGAAAALVAFTSASSTADRLRDQIESLAAEIHDPRLEFVRSSIACVVGSKRGMPLAELDLRSQDALNMAKWFDDTLLLMFALHARLLALALAGDLDELERLGPDIERAGRENLVPFAVQRSRLLRQSIALARGQVDGLISEITETMELGARIGAAATDAPMAQLIAARLEFGEYDVVIDLLPASSGDETAGMIIDVVRTLALAELRPDPDDPDVAAQIDALLPRLAGVPDIEVTPPLAAFASELAWWVGSAPLASWALGHLNPELHRMVVTGFGTIIHGPEEVFAGLAHHVLGRPDEAIELLESGLHRLEKANAGLLAARARIYLAAAYRSRGGRSDLQRAGALAASIGPTVRRLDSLARRAEMSLASSH
jgi:DNA-binding SARP family transcriptional activator